MAEGMSIIRQKGEKVERVVGEQKKRRDVDGGLLHSGCSVKSAHSPAGAKKKEGRKEGGRWGEGVAG